MNLFGVRIIESRYIPEGFVLFDEGKSVVAVSPEGYALRVEKPRLSNPPPRFFEGEIK